MKLMVNVKKIFNDIERANRVWNEFYQLMSLDCSGSSTTTNTSPLSSSFSSSSSPTLLHLHHNNHHQQNHCANSFKSVQFRDQQLVEINLLPEDEDRKGPWQQLGADRQRFKTRCDEVERVLAPVFSIEHRAEVYRRLQQQ